MRSQRHQLHNHTRLTMEPRQEIAFGLSASSPQLTKTLFQRVVHNSQRSHCKPSRQWRTPTSQASSPPLVIEEKKTAAMKYNRLGSSDLIVSEVCLGTMTWGMQNTEADAHQQLGYAISRGVNFIDTAEMYPAPSAHPDHVPGLTEKYIGTFLSKHPELRSKLVIATKVLGFERNSRIAAYRYEPLKEPFPDTRHDPQSIFDACNASLKRLQTDYIDLYQLHWPDRYVPGIRTRGYNPQHEWKPIHFRDILLTIKKLLDTGKIRAYGLSNESTYGVCQFVRYADEIGMPRPVSIQNSFCLLNRSFEHELAEACSPRNYNIGLLPWSILAGGVLTGKYTSKNNPTENSEQNGHTGQPRFSRFSGYQTRFISPRALQATEKYEEVAKRYGIPLATLAQAFCKSRWYIPSSIVGATSVNQLKDNIDAFSVDLNDEVLADIDEIHNSGKDCIIPFEN